ncbi:MAG TPA: hypothetical protein PKI32_06750 [Opitutales bacterium]|nr:hypothetical protein [Opitutales bacterium]
MNMFFKKTLVLLAAISTMAAARVFGDVEYQSLDGILTNHPPPVTNLFLGEMSPNYDMYPVSTELCRILEVYQIKDDDSQVLRYTLGSETEPFDHFLFSIVSHGDDPNTVFTLIFRITQSNGTVLWSHPMVWNTMGSSRPAWMDVVPYAWEAGVWRYVGALGWMYPLPGADHWFFSHFFGSWIYVDAAGTADNMNIWVYDGAHSGWLWTGQDSLNWVYSYDRNAWEQVE